MTNAPTRVPAGWYPDPMGESQLRWWDSYGWTEQTSPREPFLAQEAGLIPPRSAHQEPDYSDWHAVSEAIRDAALPGAPTIISVTTDTLPTLLIDVAERAYWWDLDLGEFPPVVSGLRLSASYPGEVAPPFRAGQPLEPLLWAIGTASFAGTSAPWLEPGARYKLRRWPNLTSMAHTVDQMRMTSILGHAQMTTLELAAAAGTSRENAQTLINTYSLMGILHQETPSAASVPPVRTQPSDQSSAPSLFNRLRMRLGL